MIWDSCDPGIIGELGSFISANKENKTEDSYERHNIGLWTAKEVS